MASIVKATKSAIKKPLYALQRKAYLSGMLSQDKLSLPSFLVLGSGQSGSSWLQENLNAHPGCFLPDKKETHYFSREFDEWPLSYYASLFDDGEGLVRGEITPVYTILKPDRIRFIHELLPDARLIIVVRYPVDRAWSAGRRVITKVAASLGTTFDDIDDNEFYEFFRNEWTYRPERGMAGYFEPGHLQAEYSKAIDKWLQYYDEEQLLVCFFDQLKSQPRAFLTRICEHIGASTDIDWDALPMSRVVNRNPSHPMPDRFREFLESLYADEIAELKRRFPAETAHWP